jgi:hypothetical protein
MTLDRAFLVGALLFGIGCQEPRIALLLHVLPTRVVAEPMIGDWGDDRTWSVRLNGTELQSYAPRSGSDEWRHPVGVPVAPDGLYRWEIDDGPRVIVREQRVPLGRMALPPSGVVRIGDELPFRWPHVDEVVSLVVRGSGDELDPDPSCITTEVTRLGADDAIATVVAPACSYSPPRPPPTGPTHVWFRVDVADGADTGFSLYDSTILSLEFAP